MKYFCKKCWKTNIYQFDPPLFCGYCGIQFNSKNNNDITNPITSSSDVNKDQNIEQYELKKVKPKFELTVYKDNGSSLGDLVSTHDSVDTSPDLQANIQNYPREIGAPKSNEEILREFQQESSSLRSSD